jgi:metabotropic glutamate receptor 3
VHRVGTAFGFVVVYSALFVKTNRIARIFDSATRSAKRPRFISRKSQVVISTILISFQGVFSGVWLLYEKPDTKLDFPSGQRDKVFLKCKFENHSFFISLTYIVILIATCTFYAIKTRKIPENFNESKFIGFTMYTVRTLAHYKNS